FCQCSAYGLFVEFAELTRNGSRAFGTEIGDKLFYSFQQSVRRFVEDHGTLFLYQLFQARLSSLFYGKEALKTEAVVGKSRTYQGRNECCRTRKTLHFYAFFDSLTDQ